MTQPSSEPVSVVRRLAALAPKVLRLSLFLGVLAAVLWFVVSGYMANQVRAQLGEQLMDVGKQMMEYEFANPQGDPQKMAINGQTFWINTGNTDRPVDDVLDWFEARCMEQDGQMARQLEESLAQIGETLPIDSSLLDATIRESEPGQHGFVACLDTGAGKLGMEALTRRVQSFTQTLRLSDIGDLRYVYVRKGHQKTMFVTLWTEGVLDVGEMFAEGGDVPGVDIAGVPRPRDARRILSVTPEGKPQSVTMYSNAEARTDVQAYYKEQMPLRGWEPVVLTEEQAAALPFKQAPSSDDLLYFKLNGRDVAIVVNDENTEGQTVTAVLTL